MDVVRSDQPDAEVFRYLRQALEAKDTWAEVRANALFQLALCEAEDRNFSVAIDLLKELVQLRRGSEDWRARPAGMHQAGSRQPDQRRYLYVGATLRRHRCRAQTNPQLTAA